MIIFAYYFAAACTAEGKEASMSRAVSLLFFRSKQQGFCLVLCTTMSVKQASADVCFEKKNPSHTLWSAANKSCNISSGWELNATVKDCHRLALPHRWQEETLYRRSQSGLSWKWSSNFLAASLDLGSGESSLKQRQTEHRDWICACPFPVQKTVDFLGEAPLGPIDN